MLSNPEAVPRIRSVSRYRDQPNLDIYAPAFVGVGISNRFAGTDIDGFFGIMLQQPMHGMWERNGFVLIQEHKKHSPEDLDKASGQFRALSAFANIDSERICVIFTFGPTDQPAQQRWFRLFARGRTSQIQQCTDDPETWPHRQWIKKALGRSVDNPGLDSPEAEIAIVSGDPRPTAPSPGSFSCFHCGRLTDVSYSVGSLYEPGDSYRMCAVCWRAGIDPEQSKRQWAIKIAKQLKDDLP